MILGCCSCCGEWAVIHGHEDRVILLCDRCCPCHNHAPPLAPHREPGKYWLFSMTGTWYREAMISLLDAREAEP